MLYFDNRKALQVIQLQNLLFPSSIFIRLVATMRCYAAGIMIFQVVILCARTTRYWMCFGVSTALTIMFIYINVGWEIHHLFEYIPHVYISYISTYNSVFHSSRNKSQRKLPKTYWACLYVCFVCTKWKSAGARNVWYEYKVFCVIYGSEDNSICQQLFGCMTKSTSTLMWILLFIYIFTQPKMRIKPNCWQSIAFLGSWMGGIEIWFRVSGIEHNKYNM